MIQETKVTTRESGDDKKPLDEVIDATTSLADTQLETIKRLTALEKKAKEGALSNQGQLKESRGYDMTPEDEERERLAAAEYKRLRGGKEEEPVMLEVATPAQILNKKSEDLQKIQEQLKTARLLGDVEREEALLEERDAKLAEVKELIGEDFQEKITAKTKERLGEKGMTEREFKKKKMPGIKRELLAENKMNAEIICCNSGHGKKLFDLDQKDGGTRFEFYMQEKLEASGLDSEEFYGMICRGVRVDLFREKVAFWRSVGNFVTGNESVAHKYEIPTGPEGPDEVIKLSESELKAFLFDQAKKQEAEIKKESEKRFSRKLREGKARLQETKVGVAQEIIDEALETGQVAKVGKAAENVPKESEYDAFKKDTPPIPAGFFASYGEKLKKTKKNEKETREGARAGLRENLGLDEKIRMQERALAECEIFIDQEIENNPDVEKGTLTAWVEKFATDYDFRKEQKEMLLRQIDLYLEKRAKFKIFWEKFGNKDNKIELIKALTGKELTPKQAKGISVSQIPTGVIFEGDKDTLLLLRVKGVLDIGETPSPNFASRSKSKSPENNDIDYVALESYASVLKRERTKREKENKKPLSKEQIKQLEKDVKNIRLHELQHVNYYRKDADNRDRLEKKADQQLVEYKQAKAAEREARAQDYVKSLQRQGLNKVKNEILACFYDQGIVKLQQKLEQYFLKGAESRYDYFEDPRQKVVYQKIEKDHPSMVKKVMIEDYATIIQASTKALTELFGNNKDEAFIERAIAFLTKKDFEFWPRNISSFIGEEAKKAGEPAKQAEKPEKPASLEDANDFDELKTTLRGKKNQLEYVNKTEASVNGMKQKKGIALLEAMPAIYTTITGSEKGGPALKKALLKLFKEELLNLKPEIQETKVRLLQELEQDQAEEEDLKAEFELESRFSLRSFITLNFAEEKVEQKMKVVAQRCQENIKLLEGIKEVEGWAFGISPQEVGKKRQENEKSILERKLRVAKKDLENYKSPLRWLDPFEEFKGVKEDRVKRLEEAISNIAVKELTDVIQQKKAQLEKATTDTEKFDLQTDIDVMEGKLLAAKGKEGEVKPEVVKSEGMKKFEKGREILESEIGRVNKLSDFADIVKKYPVLAEAEEFGELFDIMSGLDKMSVKNIADISREDLQKGKDWATAVLQDKEFEKIKGLKEKCEKLAYAKIDELLAAKGKEEEVKPEVVKSEGVKQLEILFRLPVTTASTVLTALESDAKAYLDTPEHEQEFRKLFTEASDNNWYPESWSSLDPLDQSVAEDVIAKILAKK